MSVELHRVLVVDDNKHHRHSVREQLSRSGYQVEAAESGEQALEMVAHSPPHLMLVDARLPGIDGVSTLRRARALRHGLVGIIMSAHGTVEVAVDAMKHGAIDFLVKPVPVHTLDKAVARGLAKAARRARYLAHRAQAATEIHNLAGDRSDLEASFARALSNLEMHFHPIVSLHAKAVAAYEALLRSRDTFLSTPALLLDAAERLGQVHVLGRAVRAAVGREVPRAPAGVRLFVNLHPDDLLDESLYAADAPLASFAERVVLEVTERHALEDVPALSERVATLRRLGYHIAVDDLGAGYSGLASFAQMEPQVIKLDMALIRGVDKAPTKRKLVASMIGLGRELGLEVVCEGVETRAERDALAALGGDLLQGYLFARPAPAFSSVPSVAFED